MTFAFSAAPRDDWSANGFPQDPEEEEAMRAYGMHVTKPPGPTDDDEDDEDDKEEDEGDEAGDEAAVDAAPVDESAALNDEEIALEAVDERDHLERLAQQLLTSDPDVELGYDQEEL